MKVFLDTKYKGNSKISWFTVIAKNLINNQDTLEQHQLR